MEARGELPDRLDLGIVRRAAMRPDIEGSLRLALAEVTELMASAFAEVHGALSPDTALDQCGLRDGGEIIEDYLRHGELGIAFEHLLYMIREPRLPISRATYQLIDKVGRKLEMDPRIWEEYRP